MPLDIVDTPTLVESHKTQGVPWAVTGIEDDCTTAVAIKAAESGKSHYITYCALSCSVAGQLMLQDEDDNIIFCVAGGTNVGNALAHEFKHPVKMVANKALEIKQQGAGECTVYVEGYTV